MGFYIDNQFMINLLGKIQTTQIAAAKAGYGAHVDVYSNNGFPGGNAKHISIDVTIFEGGESRTTFGFPAFDSKEKLEKRFKALEAYIDSL